MLFARLAACLVCLGVAASSAAQGTSEPKSATGTATRAPAPSSAKVDVNTIDPETFRAIAFRLPPGKAPKIDGRLDDEAWTLAEPVGGFIQREPNFGAPASERTEFRILYDDRRIYFGIWCFDSNPAGIRASEAKRDAMLTKGDLLKINIDPFHDHRNAFYFATNPLGARKDANTTENGRTINYDWNAVWQAKTSRDHAGWYVEIAVPLNQLRFKGSLGQATWGLNVCRVIVRKNEETYWVPFPREWGSTGFARVERAGHLTGLSGLMSHRPLEFVPFAAPTITRDYDAGTSSNRGRYGFDFRAGLASNLTTDITYHTDFAQVEADQEVVNTSRFSLFFPEKRQFFTESAGIFDYGRAGGSGLTGPELAKTPGLLPLFYSRRIGLDDSGREVPLLFGARMAGRTGKYAIGLMNVETGETTLPNGGSDLFVPRANYTVVRAKRNILGKSSVGGIFVNRQGGPGAAFNRGVGADLGLSFGSAATLTGMLAKTFSPGSSGRNLAGVLDVAYRTDAFNAGLTYLDIGEKFDAAMGFIPRTDIRSPSVKGAWTPRPKWRGVRQVTLGAEAAYFGNHAGQKESRTSALTFGIDRQDSALFRTSIRQDYDFLPYVWAISPGRTVPIGGYTWNTFEASYSTNQSRPAYVSATVDLGGYYSGSKRTCQVNFGLVPFGTLLLENYYTRNDMDLAGYSKYATNVFSSRVSYSFSPDLFLKTFVQYNDERRTASFNFLFWYVYRPGSDLYVVYNEGRETGLPGPRDTRPRIKSLAVKMTFWLSR
jgi:hypothetical protein